MVFNDENVLAVLGPVEDSRVQKLFQLPIVLGIKCHVFRDVVLGHFCVPFISRAMEM